MEFTFSDKLLLLIAKTFDYTRKQGFRISSFSLYGPEPGIIFEFSKKKRIAFSFIDNDYLLVEIEKQNVKDQESFFINETNYINVVQTIKEYVDNVITGV